MSGPFPMRVYIAGASVEAARCKSFGEEVERAGARIAVKWWDDVLAAKCHDRELSEELRLSFAAKDLNGVHTSDLFWLVVPQDGHGRGAWFEFGAALGLRAAGRFSPGVIVSGDCLSSIFTSLAYRQFATHADALAWVLEEVKARAA